MSTMTTENQIRENITLWSKEVAKSQQLQDVKIEIKNLGNEGGYTGNMAFVSVNGTTNKGDEKELHVALKFGKVDPNMREMNIGTLYMRELYVYETVLPTFKDFEERKGVKNKFDAVAECYKTLVDEGNEVLCLQNLKSEGYALHNNKATMDNDHIELILENYAKFHAISFALRDQEPDNFNEKFQDYSSTVREVILSENLAKLTSPALQKTLETARGSDPALTEKFLKVYSKSPNGELREFFRNLPKEVVVTHGDCWNNNFMFKYEGARPVKVAILDWQISILHSPVMDLAYFIYACASYEQLTNLQDLLKFYHENLSKHIKAMGSDPDKVFPYETLLKHWKIYRVYGITMLMCWLELMLCDKDDIKDFNDKNEVATAEEWSPLATTDRELYRRRMIEIMRHYCLDK